MKVEVVAFLSPELFHSSDEGLWRQAHDSASYEGVTGVYLMPDTHLGFGVPIGGVVVTDGVIIQAGSGYDISCGILAMQLSGLHASDIVDPAVRKRWVEAVELRVALGLGSHQAKFQRTPNHNQLEEIFRFGAKALGVQEDLCERPFIPVGDSFDSQKIERAIAKAALQLGSLGGGNHFIELQVDEKDGSVWAMVHCGSRGYGWHTANWFFYEGSRARGLQPRQREKSWLYADEELGKLYWDHHNSAANYAIANRHTIAKGIHEATLEVFGVPVQVYYEISHNLVQEETLVLPDGSVKKGFVHRKGATRALPAGHPDLMRSTWRETGHPCLIPGSMLSGAAILFPLEGAYKSGCSVNHGSGRVMGRGAAKRELVDFQADIDFIMESTSRKMDGVEVVGIVGNTDKTPLDECDLVYKDLDKVLGILAAEGIARVDRRLYPVANIKSTD